MVCYTSLRYIRLHNLYTMVFKVASLYWYDVCEWKGMYLCITGLPVYRSFLSMVHAAFLESWSQHSIDLYRQNENYSTWSSERSKEKSFEQDSMVENSPSILENRSKIRKMVPFPEIVSYIYAKWVMLERF